MSLAFLRVNKKLIFRRQSSSRCLGNGVSESNVVADAITVTSVNDAPVANSIEHFLFHSE